MSVEVEKAKCCPNSAAGCNQPAEKEALADCPLFENDCKDCEMCHGLNNFGDEKGGISLGVENSACSSPFKSLSLLDKQGCSY